MNTIAFLRPEDRQRSGGALLPPPSWDDTAPACFRSEAFPEDLPPESADVGLTLGDDALRPS